MARSVRLEEISWPDAREATAQDKVVIIPFGSIEQHGPHIPLGTDSINLTQTAIEAAEKADALVAPTQVYGVSHNHLDYPGTMSLEPETLIAIIQDLIGSLVHNGFRRILLINGHGGNNDTIEVGAIKARKRFPHVLIGHTYSGSLARGSHGLWRSGYVYHADEGETSRMMAHRPDLVDMDKALRDVTPIFDDYYHRYYNPNSGKESLTGLVTYGLPQTQVLAASGCMGDSSQADAELGQQANDMMVETLVRVIRDLQTREHWPTDRVPKA